MTSRQIPTGKQALLDHMFLWTREKHNIEVATQASAHPSHNHAILDTIMQDTMVTRQAKASGEKEEEA